jgi:DNA repair exonuclease SbcCD nuclease subunit
MTSFRFLHAADIHLDSPLHGLSRYDGVPADEVRGATRAAFDNLIQCAIDEAVDFVVIAGDLFDGDWKDMGTGLYFARAMGRLNQADIPVFVLAGNHDAASVLTKSVPWPPNVQQFSSRKPQTHRIERLSVAVHGQSFANAAVSDNLALGYPEPDEHAFNIGVLHTALAGRPGHAEYAPCTVDDLRAKGYDYWALGHVHAHEVACEDPYVVFPGNIQGRTIRETGPKGAVLVDVTDREVTSVTPIELDVIRWARVEVDCANASADAALPLMREALVRAHTGLSAGRPMVARLILTGETDAAGELQDKASALRDDARALAASISPELWIEKVQVLVSPPATQAPFEIGEDFAALIAEAPTNAALALALAEDLSPFVSAAHASLGDAEENELRHAADAGDWPRLVSAATLALQSRLAAAD